MITSKYIIQSELNSVYEPLLPKLEMIYVNGGSFEMGDGSEGNDNEIPIHHVTLDDFCISRNLITQAQWIAIMGYNPSHWQGLDLPVENISFMEVQDYIQRLNKKTGKHYRLPTEAEWEYAAKGGNCSKGFMYAGSNDLAQVAWYSSNGDEHTHPVGTKEANEIGLYDMSGNLWEWVNDWYDKSYYYSSPEHNPLGPDTGVYKVLRGGRFGSPAARCRIASRCFCELERKCNAHGFRLVLPSEEFEDVLIFSTMTAQMRTITKKQYYEIFVKGLLPQCSLLANLISEGFIVESHEKEYLNYQIELNKRLEQLRNSVAILTTTDCNANCFYCFEKGIDKTISMSDITIKNAIKFINDYYIDKNLNVYWFGGEPLMKFDVIKSITEKLIACGFTLTTHIVTNLSLLNEEMVKFFKSNYEHVSFEIPIDDINDKYNAIKRYNDRDSEQAFNDVINNVKLLLDHNIFVSISINYVLSKVQDKIECYYKLKEILSDYPSSMYYMFFTPLSLDGDKELVTKYKGIMEHPYLQISNLRINNQKNIDRAFLLNTLALRPKKPCEIDAKRKMLTINADGTIYNCIRLVGREKYKIGSVFEGITKLDDVLEKQFECHNPSSQCKDCNILPICLGGCVARKILWGNGHECHKIKQVQKELIEIYYQELNKI